MPQTYSKIIIHLVFSTKGRRPLISDTWEQELFYYISGMPQHMGHKMLAMNGMPDHVHVLMGIRPDTCLSDLVREIKKSTTKFIKVKGFCSEPFQWQEGYGAFSISSRELSNVANYIAQQKEHHQKIGFKEEYLAMLDELKIDYKDEYMWG